MALQTHKTALKTQGLTRVDALFLASELLFARDQVLQIASDHGLYTSTGWVRTENRFGVDKAFRKVLKRLNESNLFPDFINETVLRLTEELVGEPIHPLPPGQQILFTLPDVSPWSVPHDVWHVDTPRLGPLGAPGLQIFICLDDIAPKGGGTLVVAGSHRLYDTSERLRSRQLKTRLAQEDYFKWLFDATRAPITRLEDTSGTVGDVPLEVVELSGRAGDAYLMDLRALHTPSPNASDSARIMLTCRLPRASVVSAILNPKG